MKKTIWLCLLVLSLIFSSMSTRPCAAANQLPDIEAHWAKNYIGQLYNLGYMAGYPDGTFKPDRNMTRAEFTSALITCLEVTPSDTVSSSFSDTRGNWAIGAINEAVKRGILVPSEYPNGLVPNGNIKRSEACAMLVRALGKNAAAIVPPFNDKDKIEQSMYAGYITTAFDLSLMSGYSNGNFEPFADLPRGQACTVLYKLLAYQGKVPAVPTSTAPTPTTGSTGSIRYVVIDDQSYDLKTVPVSIITEYQEVPINNISVSTSAVIINNYYSFDLNSSNNPDIIVYNNRYGINKLAISGDNLLVSPSCRKIYKFSVGDYIYNSDYINLYIKSTNNDHYLSDMEIIDEHLVNIDNQEYDLRTDKITISVSNGETSNQDFYDIDKIDLNEQDTKMHLITTDPVVMSQLDISDIAAIFADDTTLSLDSINHIYFMVGGIRYPLSEVTIDATGNFSAESKVYPYSQVTMIVDDMQYQINSLQINKSRFVFYCSEGAYQEWVILNDEYRSADDVSIIKGTSIYTLDQIIVVKRDVIRISGKQYDVDSDFKCRVDNKIYYIDEIYYDTAQQVTIIDTGDVDDTSIADQPTSIVFFNNETKYQKGTANSTIYTGSKWVTFNRIAIPDPAHFIYQDTTYDLIGAKIKIDDLEFEVTDTSWHGASQILDIYLQE